MKHFILGLTGSMGSGKSTVAKLLAQKYGFFIVDADKTAREVLENDIDVLYQLVDEFGNDILENGVLNRRLLAKYAFASPQNTERLNAITHPAILRKMSEKIDAAKRNGNSLILLDVPLLFECGWNSLCDKVLSVISPYELKIQRVMKRDGITRDEVEARLKQQKTDNFYMDNSDYIIINDGDLPEVKVDDFMVKLRGGDLNV